MNQPRFAVLDVETTGLNPTVDRIVEIAVVTLDENGYFLGEWASRVNPQGPIGASHIHHITQAEVDVAPLFADLAQPLAAHLSGATLVAHNADFDGSFLYTEFERAGWEPPMAPWICTMRSTRSAFPEMGRYRLADCCEAIGRPLTNAHSALGDARAAAWLMHHHLTSGDSRFSLTPAEVAKRGEPWPASPVRAPQPPDPGAMHRSAQIAAYYERKRQPRPIKSLVEILDRASLTDMIDQYAPEGSLDYLELLAEVLEDGLITLDEAESLDEVALALSLTSAEVAKANTAFVLALAIEALDDGHVSREERSELVAISEMLNVSEEAVPSLLKTAEKARHERLSHGLAPLPVDWPHGEPLRVGDRVVFTGCYSYDREALERDTDVLGVFVTSSVSGKTTILVSDGTMDGGKAAKARDLGTRVIHPDVFLILRQHLQPALPKPEPVRVARVRSESASSHHTDVTFEKYGVRGSTVRAWGKNNGWDVSQRGRIPADLLAAYLELHSPN